MSYDAYVKFDGGLGKVPGNVPKGARFGWISVLSFSFGATQTGSFQYGGGGSSGKVQFQDFHFTYPSGDPDPVLFQACTSGSHFKEVVLEVLKAGAGEQMIFKSVFKDVLVSSFTSSGSGHGDPIPTVSISINFASLESSYSKKTDKAALLLQHDLDSALA